MKRKAIAVSITIALMASAAIPLLNYFNNDMSNNQIVFEYDNKKIYESEVAPYVEYYSKINESFDTDSKNYAVDNYIRSVLLSKFSQENGVVINDIDVLNYINKSPIFQENEKFSKEKYDDFLNKIGVKASVFEGEVRKDLYIVALMEKIDGLTNIQDYYFNIINETLAQKRKIQKIRIRMGEIPVVYDRELLELKYEQNKDKYRKPAQIIFTKYTYSHPLNQSEKQEDMDLVQLETNTLYNEISKLTSKELSAKIIGMDVSRSSMILDQNDFTKLLGTKKALNLENGSFLIDTEGLDHGSISIYEVTNITKGRQMDYQEAYYALTKDYENDMKLDMARKYIAPYTDFKKAEMVYFDKTTEETIDPLKNDQTEDFYNVVYSIPVGGFNLYYDKDNGQYYFIKVKGVEQMVLTEDELKYFRTSQNNMYKQFTLLSLYDSLKKKYNLKRYKKES